MMAIKHLYTTSDRKKKKKENNTHLFVHFLPVNMLLQKVLYHESAVWHKTSELHIHVAILHDTLVLFIASVTEDLQISTCCFDLLQ